MFHSVFTKAVVLTFILFSVFLRAETNVGQRVVAQPIPPAQSSMCQASSRFFMSAGEGCQSCSTGLVLSLLSPPANSVVRGRTRAEAESGCSAMGAGWRLPTQSELRRIGTDFSGSGGLAELSRVLPYASLVRPSGNAQSLEGRYFWTADVYYGFIEGETRSEGGISTPFSLATCGRNKSNPFFGTDPLGCASVANLLGSRERALPDLLVNPLTVGITDGVNAFPAVCVRQEVAACASSLASTETPFSGGIKKISDNAFQITSRLKRSLGVFKYELGTQFPSPLSFSGVDLAGKNIEVGELEGKQATYNGKTLTEISNNSARCAFETDRFRNTPSGCEYTFRDGHKAIIHTFLQNQDLYMAPSFISDVSTVMPRLNQASTASALPPELPSNRRFYTQFGYYFYNEGSKANGTPDVGPTFEGAVPKGNSLQLELSAFSPQSSDLRAISRKSPATLCSGLIDGYHVPTQTEWNTLFEDVQGNVEPLLYEGQTSGQKFEKNIWVQDTQNLAKLANPSGKGGYVLCFKNNPVVSQVGGNWVSQRGTIYTYGQSGIRGAIHRISDPIVNDFKREFLSTWEPVAVENARISAYVTAPNSDRTLNRGLSGSSNSIGLVARYNKRNGVESYYRMDYTAEGQTSFSLNFYRMEGGLTKLATFSLPYPLDAVFRGADQAAIPLQSALLTLVIDGSILKGFVNDRLIGQVTDTRLTGPGFTGIFMQEGLFDSVKLSIADAMNPMAFTEFTVNEGSFANATLPLADLFQWRKTLPQLPSTYFYGDSTSRGGCRTNTGATVTCDGAAYPPLAPPPPPLVATSAIKILKIGSVAVSDETQVRNSLTVSPNTKLTVKFETTGSVDCRITGVPLGSYRVVAGHADTYIERVSNGPSYTPQAGSTSYIKDFFLIAKNVTLELSPRATATTQLGIGGTILVPVRFGCVQIEPGLREMPERRLDTDFQLEKLEAPTDLRLTVTSGKRYHLTWAQTGLKAEKFYVGRTITRTSNGVSSSAQQSNTVSSATRSYNDTVTPASGSVITYTVTAALGNRSQASSISYTVP